MAQPPLSYKLDSQVVPFMCLHPSLVVEPSLLLAGQWEEFTQASQLQGLAVTTDHQPLLSMEDQLCRGMVVVL